MAVYCGKLAWAYLGRECYGRKYPEGSIKAELFGLHVGLFLWLFFLREGTQLKECHSSDLQHKAQDSTPVTYVWGC